MPNSFFNPFTEFKPLDFSLWAHPAAGSQISEDPSRVPLGPTNTSPLYQPSAAPLSPDAASTANIGGITLPAPKAASVASALAPADPNAINPNQSSLGKLHDKIRNHLTGDAPEGYEGILSPEDIQKARPGLGQSLFGTDDAPSPQTRWKNNLDEIVGRRQQAAGILANQRMQADTAKIFSDNPPPKSGSAADFAKWANQVIPALAAKGNFGAVEKLTPLVKDYNAESVKPGALDTSWEDIGGEKVLTDKRTGAVLARIKKTPAPKDASAISADQKNSQDQTNKILDDYARDTKDFHQVMGGWDVLKGATKNPSLATPFAVTDAYARITNPGAIVRPTTMEMIDNMGSIGQRMRKFWDHNANGALPPDILKDFSTTLYNIVKEHKNQFDQIRSQAILRGSRSGVNDISSLLQNYQVDDPNAPPVINKYKIDPVRK